ncbi:MAG: lytic murein transglycosylase B [Nevskiaceae bacterium]|nr:lytic murein transglycosylase B [Nevskiaceae bacterium]
MPRVGVALATALSALTCAQAAAPPTKKLDVSRADVQQFIGTMAETHRFDPKELTATLSGATTQGRIIEAISRPAERTIPWWEYRDRFLTNARIDAGVALWAQQQATLDRIAADTGVPAEYLLAITGVETSFGRIMGSYRVLDALTTLAFDYPRRSEFFTQELEQYLLLARDENLSPDTPLGSYAGAMGAPQFMPSSVRRYAVDGDGDGRRDLWGNWADVFASIANYLKAYGWRRDEPVLVDAQISGPADDPANTRLELNETVSGLRARGYRFDTALADSTQAMLVPAQQRDALQWRVGFANFYAITRYNRSALYAMAVNDLAQALAQRRRAQSVGAASAPATAPAPASE